MYVASANALVSSANGTVSSETSVGMVNSVKVW